MSKVSIMFVCAGGMSSSLVASKMEKAAATYDFEIEIWATGVAHGKETLAKRDDIDYLLIGPQVRYSLGELQAVAKDNGRKTIIQVADMRDYGMVNGEKILHDVMNALQKQEVI